MNNIVVVGSLNMDLVVQIHSIHKLGETAHGHNFATNPGGMEAK